MMNNFSLPQSPFDTRPMGYGTLGIGDGLPQNQPTEPFVWGAGGARLTPEQLLAQQEMARNQMQSDFSPVGHWTQGLGRVVDNAMGALDMRRLDKAEKANAERSNGVLQALMGSPDQQTLISAAADPYLDAGAKDVATLLLKNSLPKQSVPHYWETNDGSLGMVGANGQPTILYKDPTPKINWIQADNGDGTKSLIPMGPSGPLTAKGGDPFLGGDGGDPTPPPSLEPDILLNRAKQQGFISPEDYSSIKTQLGPNGQTALDGWLTGSGVKVGQQIDGKMFYQVNGKWYDNPEGR